MVPLTEQLPLALGWIFYAALHSLLADLRVKAAVTARLPGFAAWYRLAYNGVALITALPLLWLMRAMPGPELWAWSGAFAWLGNGLAVAALFGAMQSSKAYAMNDFLGLGVLGGDKDIERDVFRLSAPHRFVRHPWYSFGLVIVWTRDMNAAMLVSALAITLYFVAGSWLEEQKLIAIHGDTYRRYRERVPGLLPLPWKYLRRDEADSFR
jgi:protein-S-isoprenylcysteine O-methyltransferase Ste14